MTDLLYYLVLAAITALALWVLWREAVTWWDEYRRTKR